MTKILSCTGRLPPLKGRSLSKIFNIFMRLFVTIRWGSLRNFQRPPTSQRHQKTLHTIKMSVLIISDSQPTGLQTVLHNFVMFALATFDGKSQAAHVGPSHDCLRVTDHAHCSLSDSIMAARVAARFRSLFQSISSVNRFIHGDKKACPRLLRYENIWHTWCYIAKKRANIILYGTNSIKAPQGQMPFMVRAFHQVLSAENGTSLTFAIPDHKRDEEKSQRAWLHP